jgi:hypothetical protein
MHQKQPTLPGLHWLAHTTMDNAPALAASSRMAQAERMSVELVARRAASCRMLTQFPASPPGTAHAELSRLASQLGPLVEIEGGLMVHSTDEKRQQLLLDAVEPGLPALLPGPVFWQVYVLDASKTDSCY